MATESLDISDVVIDFDAIDAEVAKGRAADAAKTDKSAAGETVTVDTGADSSAAPEKPILKPEVGLETLKKQLEDEKTRRIAAENHAATASTGEVAARTEVQKTQLDLIKGAIAQVTQSSDALEAKYAESAAAGDWGAAAKAQREMAANAAKLQQLEAGKSALEKAPPPAVRTSADPVEAYVARIAPEFPRSREWVRAHADLARTPDGQDMLLAAHQIATRRGLVPESPEYFRSIEKTLEIVPPGEKPNGHAATVVVEDPMADAAATPVRAAPTAAPVTRSAPGASNRSVRLTAEQAEIARLSFPESKTPLEDYARQLVQLRKEGTLQ